MRASSGSDLAVKYTPAEREAWETSNLARERRTVNASVLLCIVLNLSWIGADYLIVAREQWPTFVGWRATGAVVAAIWYLAAVRAPSARAMRWLSLLGLTGFNASVAALVVQYSAAPLVAAVGYAIALLGSGLVFSWRLPMAALLQFSLVAVLAIAYLATPTRLVGEGEAIGLLLTFASTGAVAAVASSVKHRLMLLSFRTSFQLGIRNDELSRALNQLQVTQARLVESEKLSALGRLLAGLSHEINNPINVIVNSVPPLREYLAAYETVLAERQGLQVSEDDARRLEELERELDLAFARDDAPEALEAIYEAAVRIRGLHQDLSTFTRGENPKTDACDITSGLRSTVSMFERSLGPGVDIDLELDDMPAVDGRVEQLNQVCLNLLQNAVDALGGRGRVRVRGFADGNWAVVSVADSGPGIDPDIRENIFEPFFTTKDPGKGTGLGLSICHEVVTRHGGTLELVDASEGACFELRLPTRHALPAATAHSRAHPRVIAGADVR